MKPNFALNLSHDGIGLLHRGTSGWHPVGDVALDDPDLSGKLATLRRTATALSASGLASKLVIPDSQILYRTLPDPGPPETRRIEAIRAALDGVTPYALSELVFDWRECPEGLKVAVVARETLEEAEVFALDHAFNPVSFVAIPEPDQFPGEPEFGRAKAADRLIGPDTVIEPDDAPIRVLGTFRHAPVESTTMGVAPVAEAVDAESVAPEPAPDEPGEPPSDESAGEAEEAQRTAEHDAAPRDSAESAAPAEAAAAPSFASRRATPDPQDAPPADAPAEAVTTPPTEPASPADPTPPSEPVDLWSEVADQTATPATAAAAPASARVAGVTAPSMGTVAPPAEAAPEDDAHLPVTADHLSPEPKVEKRPRPVAPKRGEALPEPPPMPAPRPARLAPTPAPAPKPAPKPDVATPAMAPGGAPGTTPPIPRPVVARAEPLLLNETEAGLTPSGGGTSTAEAEALTVFGARRKAVAAGRRPRHLGLILTLALLAGLALVYLLAGRTPDPATAELSDAAPVQTEQIAPLDDEAALDVADAQDIAPDLASQPAGTMADSAAAAPPAPAALDSVIDTPDRAATFYARTGIWPLAPASGGKPDTGGQDLGQLYIASIDPVISATDAVSLPDPRRALAEPLPRAPTSPAPPGAGFDFDARGLVRATPDGAATPEGAVVFAGRPEEVPPPRPLQAAIDPADQDAETVASASDAQNPERLALALVRPVLRPEDLAERQERAVLGGLTEAELAALRPSPRPATPQELAQSAAEAGGQDAPPPTAPTVSASLVPDARPANFAQLAAAARAASQAASLAAIDAGTVQTAAAPPAPAESVAPAIPTRASVAREATLENALNLRQLNLIGVYGASNSRRALVRLPSGRYAQVKVGDRLDGGQVAAIGDGQLRYIKGGRTLVLEIPRG